MEICTSHLGVEVVIAIRRQVGHDSANHTWNCVVNDASYTMSEREGIGEAITPNPISLTLCVLSPSVTGCLNDLTSLSGTGRACSYSGRLTSNIFQAFPVALQWWEGSWITGILPLTEALKLLKVGDGAATLVDTRQDRYYTFSEGPHPAHGKRQANPLDLACRTPHANYV